MIMLTGQMTLEDAGIDFLGDRTDADNAEILALRVYYKHRSSAEMVLATLAFTAQSFCGEKRILAPLQLPP
ncbi:hypothetical protein PF005_g23583 [Phytophthora fragariae]|uniref:Uncharacterized protein n=1 Tax=Phytophthora fragariae TaxID=53985 RepID=A0A6A3VY44_9STRA|nr:hypothetical protein PF011_g32789 [Phytophthora fragariae]KAE9173191.1 hypothetical protein PF002_g29372 [Phytophthora fragariae]KAE9179713.1 hypothetical protein PF005_g23583 [Phytophthora fragariae]